jgi:hypothetical protein
LEEVVERWGGLFFSGAREREKCAVDHMLAKYDLLGFT